MAVLAERRRVDELRAPASAGEGGVHPVRQPGKKLVVLRVDPQRRNARGLAERCERAPAVLVADVILVPRAPAAGKVDRGDKSCGGSALSAMLAKPPARYQPR